MLENLNRQQTSILTVGKSLPMQHKSQLGNSASQKRDFSESPCPKRFSGYPGGTLWLWPTHSSRFCLPTWWTETDIEEMWISQLQLQGSQQEGSTWDKDIWMQIPEQPHLNTCWQWSGFVDLCYFKKRIIFKKKSECCCLSISDFASRSERWSFCVTRLQLYSL